MSPNHSANFDDEFEGGDGNSSIDPLAANDSELRHAQKIIKDESEDEFDDDGNKIDLDKELLGSALTPLIVRSASAA